MFFFFFVILSSLVSEKKSVVDFFFRLGNIFFAICSASLIHCGIARNDFWFLCRPMSCICWEMDNKADLTLKRRNEL